jgi:hypothetical protein
VNKLVITFAAIGLLISRGALAQGGPAPANATPNIVPLKVQVVISRYQGEKKLSSLPYTLSVNANDRSEMSRMRMGVKVPVRTIAPAVVDGKEMPTGVIQYQDVGTNIDCYASQAADGRFKVTVSVEDTSVVGEEGTAGASRLPNNPAFRSFSLTNSAMLKDGQSTQFSAATDKVSGEVVKIDVTLTVVK